MDLKKEIERKYGTRYKFAKEKEISPQLVSYWCNKEWLQLGYKTRERIKRTLK